MKEFDLTRDEEYLDKEFPKGKTKFRGQAIVLLALAREQGRLEMKEDVEKIIDEIKDNCLIDIETSGEVKGFKMWLKQEIARLEKE